MHSGLLHLKKPLFSGWSQKQEQESVSSRQLDGLYGTGLNLIRNTLGYPQLV